MSIKPRFTLSSRPCLSDKITEIPARDEYSCCSRVDSITARCNLHASKKMASFHCLLVVEPCSIFLTNFFVADLKANREEKVTQQWGQKSSCLGPITEDTPLSLRKSVGVCGHH